MDIEKIIADVLAKLKIDSSLKAAFLSDPVGTLEKKLGIDLPDEQINEIIKGIKAKLGEGGIAGILAKIKSLFGK
ncbi:MAG: hypothetical protein IJT99_04615 [Clostridia bacterium]|jgi:acyl carrier protein|nr:hypothetical protein [Clostridia bacterium]MBQ9343468.1 hypothetical protein [Clostridia bacterium]